LSLVQLVLVVMVAVTGTVAALAANVANTRKILNSRFVFFIVVIFCLCKDATTL
jgi:hypothetical protein